jgi:S-disulfanyl-L-cysteine oxidoreductase SoxD
MSMSSDQVFDLGTDATDDEIAGWNIDVNPPGAGLPSGSGSVEQGREIFAKLGAPCHGANGEGTDAAPALVGGQDTLDTDSPKKTVGSYWRDATVLFDYIHRAMPATAPQSLTPDETYAIVAYLLNANGIIEDDAIMDQDTLPQVEMPNHDGFSSPDPRPDVFS